MSTTVDANAIASKPEPKRNQWGHYIIPGPGTGKEADPRPYRRVSTVAKVIENRFALEQWGERMVAKGMTLDQGLIAMAATHDPNVDKKAFNGIAKQAKTLAKASSKRDQGVALHRSIEQWAEGVPLAQIYAGHHRAIAAMDDKLKAKGIEILPGSTERIIVIDDLGLAGTVDMLPLVLPCGTRVVGDLKTGNMGDYSWLGWCAQTAAYAHHSATYDPVTDKRGPRVDVDLERSIIIHLPTSNDEECEVYQANIRDGYTALLLALEVEQIRKDSERWGHVYSPSTIGVGGVGAMRAWLGDRIRLLDRNPHAMAELVASWPAIVPQPIPEEPTDEMVDALDKVLSLIEQRYEAPFAPSRPGQT